mgnify:CR=1 FL=1
MNKNRNYRKIDENSINNKSLPHDINAEAAVLSAMLIDVNATAIAQENLKEEFFYRNAHKHIFATTRELFEESIEIDLITVINRLNEKDLLEKAGGKVYLNELSDVVLSAANIEHHINIVQQKKEYSELPKLLEAKAL